VSLLPPQRQTPQPGRFGRCDRLQRITESFASLGFHLHDNQPQWRTGLVGDDIQLAGSAAPIAIEDCPAKIAEMRDRQIFTPTSQGVFLFHAYNVVIFRRFRRLTLVIHRRFSSQQNPVDDADIAPPITTLRNMLRNFPT